MQAADLADPVVRTASGGAGGERVTLALAVTADRHKRVLGTWPGALAEHRCSQMVAADLRSRGLVRLAAFAPRDMTAA